MRIAGFAVGAALAVLRAEKGCALRAPPGVSPGLKRDAVRVEPFDLRARLAGEAAAEEWSRLCAEAGIGDVDLGRRPGN